MTNTAAKYPRKVTLDLETPTRDSLDRLTSAVRLLHGSVDPDLEQEVFIRTLTAFRRTSSIAYPEALMWKVVRNTVADHWRRKLRTRTEAIDQVAERRLARQPNLDEQIDRQRKLDRLHDALFALGYDTRGPMYLFYVEGYSIAKIARLSAKTVSAVKTAIWRGRQRLLESLRSEGFGPGPGLSRVNGKDDKQVAVQANSARAGSANR
jgi:RNA polymerase sigma-70 factor (ECF subfamily)